MKNKLTATLVLILFSALVMADDFRISGYGNQPVNIRATAVNSSGNTNTQVPIVSISTGSDAGVARTVSAAAETGHALKSSAGTFISLFGYNAGSAQFILVFDSPTVPAEGTASPIAVIAVGATSSFSIYIGCGIPCTTGISWCNSSTYATKTIGSANCVATGLTK